MNCIKAQRFLPLFWGGELSPRKKSSVLKHVGQCPHCEEEFGRFATSIQKAREWLLEDSVDWNKQEWEQVVRTAWEKGARPQRPWKLHAFKKSWVYGLTAAAAFALIFLVGFPLLRTGKLDLREALRLPTQKDSPLFFPEASGQQKVVSMTMVSKETGLKIVWFFHKDFDLEEEE